ncbi:MAG: 3'-5' exonuclease [Flavobacteriaceae bacterium]|nr:3'-5' exonuclease [Flavobacteriaceae bacterium]
MYAIIDIESNGDGFRKERIIEIALFLYDGHKVIDQFISLINPEEKITPFVQRLTKITPKKVKTAPKFHEVARRIVEITQGATLVGHNVEFDYRILRQSFKKLGYDFSINTIDTLPLAKKLIPDEESYSLGKLCKSIGIPHSEEHRAGGDARATLELFKVLMSKDLNNEILQSHQEEALSQKYFNRIMELTEDLPEDNGILYFQDKKGKIIHCSFADNLYKKAKKILNSNQNLHLKLQKNVEQIAYEYTGTKIIADLILNEKKLRKPIKNPFEIVYSQSLEDFIITTKRNDDELPFFKFKYFAQAERFLDFLQNAGKLNSKTLKKDVSFAKRNELWVGKGRALGEKSFLAFRKGKLIGYGFYELYHQILSWERIEKLMIPITSLPLDIKNEMLIAFLKQEFDIKKVEN